MFDEIKKFDTFSSNSLKVLDKSLDEFIDKYIYNLSLFKKDERTLLGQKYHNLISSIIKNYDISKMKKELNEIEFEKFNDFEKIILPIKNNFIKTEYSFLIKDELNGIPYFLTGRFDAIYKDNNNYIIYDWKTLNLPKNPQEDLQSIVYLYCASKIFKSENIKIRYFSIEKKIQTDVDFISNETYKKRIDSIIDKFYAILNK